MMEEEKLVESYLKGSSASTLAEVVKETLDRLIEEADIREKTEVGLEEIKAITLISALSGYWRAEGESEFSDFLNKVVEWYLKLKISHKRKSRSEVVRFMAKFSEKLREKEEEKETLRL